MHQPPEREREHQCSNSRQIDRDRHFGPESYQQEQANLGARNEWTVKQGGIQQKDRHQDRRIQNPIKYQVPNI